MDSKNLEALVEHGTVRILTSLANLQELATSEALQRFKRGYHKLLGTKKPDALAVAVDEFREVYGELYTGMGVKEYIICAKIFRHAWHAKTSREKEETSKHLTVIFERESLPGKPQIPDGLWSGLPPLEIKDPDDPRLRPAVVVDFASGEMTIKPRTLLDELARSLLEYRDRLAICERKGCQHPYFVRTHSRQRFCSQDCTNSVRQEKKEQWWVENRERFLKKWRQERKAAKRRKRA